MVPLSCRIFEATEDDLAAVKRNLEDPLLQGFVVRLRGLPYAATEEDVGDFLEVCTSLWPGSSAGCASNAQLAAAATASVEACVLGCVQFHVGDCCSTWAASATSD